MGTALEARWTRQFLAPAYIICARAWTSERSMKGCFMTDEHQTNAVVATVLIESFKDHPDHKLDPEEAKLIAKRILEALKDAGFQVTVVD